MIQENNYRTEFWCVLFFYMLCYELCDVWRNKFNSIVFIFTRWLICFLFFFPLLFLSLLPQKNLFTKLIHFQDYLLHVNYAYKKWYRIYMHLTHIYKVVAKSYARSRKIDILKKKSFFGWFNRAWRVIKNKYQLTLLHKHL